MKSIKKTKIRYSIYAISLTFLSLASPSAFAQVSVNVNGTQYQCSTNGNNNGGGGTTGVNYCRCRLEQYSTTDVDYHLEKYNPTTQQYTLLQSFRTTGNDEADRQACIEAKQDPACFFAPSASRFDLMPIQ